MASQSIGGLVCRGYQIASGKAPDSPYPGGSIALQIPIFKQLGLNLENFYPATLNLNISPYRFKITRADYEFNQVEWIDTIAGENFSFLACQIMWQERNYPGFVYYPHPETKPDHIHENNRVEIITEWIPDIRYGNRVTLIVDNSQVKLWRKSC